MPLSARSTIVCCRYPVFLLLLCCYALLYPLCRHYPPLKAKRTRTHYPLGPLDAFTTTKKRYIPDLYCQRYQASAFKTARLRYVACHRCRLSSGAVVSETPPATETQERGASPSRRRHSSHALGAQLPPCLNNLSPLVHFAAPFIILLSPFRLTTIRACASSLLR